MTTTETVRRLLLDAAGEPLCDACLALACSATLAEVRRIMAELRASPSFELRDRCARCRRPVAAIAYMAKCVHCSRAVLPGEDAAEVNGDIFHTACLTRLASDETIRISRNLSRESRRRIEESRHRLRDEQSEPPVTPTGRDGADKTAVLAKLLFERGPVCAACIVNSGVPMSDIEPAASRLQQTLTVKRDMGNCTACGRWTLVYSLFGKPRK